MARVKISWDGREAVEYEGMDIDMVKLGLYINALGLAVVNKGAGDLQYETGVQEEDSHSVSLGPDDDQGDQLDLEDAIKEVKDNGC